MANYTKTAVVAPWLAPYINEGSSRDQINDSADAYERVPLVFRATEIRCDALKRVPLYVDDTPASESDLEIYYPTGHRIGIKNLIWLLEWSLLLRGGGLMVSLKNEFNVDRGIQFINPFTVSAEWDTERKVTRFFQTIEGERYPKMGYWYEGTDAVFLRTPAPRSDVGFGVSAADNSLGGGQLVYYIQRFGSKFFESGAMPATVVSVPQGTPDKEVSRLEEFFKGRLTGIRNAFRLLAIRAPSGSKFEPTILTPDVDKLAIPAVRASAIEDVSWSFKIPKTMLLDAANYATANQDAYGFLTNTIVPRCEFYQEEFEQLGLKLRFAPEEMTEMQADENERASAFASYVAGGVDKRVAAAILGIDIPEDVLPIWEAQGKATDESRSNLPTPPTNPPKDESAVEEQQFKNFASKRVAEGHPEKVSNFKFNHLDAKAIFTLADGIPELTGKVAVVGDATGNHLQYKSLSVEDERGGLVEKFGEALTEFKSAMRENQPQLLTVPVTVNVPPPVVSVQSADVQVQPAQVIVNVPEQPAPSVTVNVPEAPTPSVTVNVPEQQPPVVNVDVPVPVAEKSKVNRDKQGNITSLEKKIEYE